MISSKNSKDDTYPEAPRYVRNKPKLYEIRMCKVNDAIQNLNVKYYMKLDIHLNRPVSTFLVRLGSNF